MTRTPKQRKASAENLKKARAARARGAVPVQSKGRSVPKTKTVEQSPNWRGKPVKPNTGIMSGSASQGRPKSSTFTGMSTQAGWTPPGLSRTLSPSAIRAIKKRG